ncbi:DUF4326 domain-containing protein [Hoeflea sp. TYP-13]|uniref:DUF4326 domain-containing protein n=1 Tax=Hoeflea sp. TYP-13 TaxID=3230023 RepID=UPI0034C6B505
MTKPVRIQLSRRRGFDLQARSRAINGLPAVSVARPGPWGNPFVIGREFVRDKMTPGGGQISGVVGDAEHAVRLYRRFTAREVALQVKTYQQLRGKNLACWCKPGEPCHADVLLEIANRDIGEIDENL